MAGDVKRLQKELADLSLTEQLQIVNWLVEKVLKQVSKTVAGNGVSQADNPQEPAAVVPPLLALAGRFAGGPGNTAEQAEEILEAAINSSNGLSYH